MVGTAHEVRFDQMIRPCKRTLCQEKYAYKREKTDTSWWPAPPWSCLDNNDNGQCNPGEPYGRNDLSTTLEGEEDTETIRPIQVIKKSGELWAEDIFIYSF